MEHTQRAEPEGGTVPARREWCIIRVPRRSAVGLVAVAQRAGPLTPKEWVVRSLCVEVAEANTPVVAVAAAADSIAVAKAKRVAAAVAATGHVLLRAGVPGVIRARWTTQAPSESKPPASCPDSSIKSKAICSYHIIYR